MRFAHSRYPIESYVTRDDVEKPNPRAHFGTDFVKYRLTQSNQSRHISVYTSIWSLKIFDKQSNAELSAYIAGVQTDFVRILVRWSTTATTHCRHQNPRRRWLTTAAWWTNTFQGPPVVRSVSALTRRLFDMLRMRIASQSLAFVVAYRSR